LPFASYEAAKKLLGQSFMVPACHGDTVESVSLSYWNNRCASTRNDKNVEGEDKGSGEEQHHKQ